MNGIQTNKSKLIIYKCSEDIFYYPDGSDTCPPWDRMLECSRITEDSAAKLHEIFTEVRTSDIPQAVFADIPCESGTIHIGLIAAIPNDSISITINDAECSVTVNSSEIDRLTGLPNRKSFCSSVKAVLAYNPEAAANGEYTLIYFDVLRFKAINDLFGTEKGDRLLVHIAEKAKNVIGSKGLLCRLDSDKYVAFIHTSEHSPEHYIEMIFNEISSFDFPFEITCNAGIYTITDSNLSADKMIDRAILAQTPVKGSYTTKYSYYTEELRRAMLSEHEIVGHMTEALAENQFELYYQPQYDHSTGMIVGSEALVRWNHPKKGLISPAAFIPIFEKNGFITKLDMYVFEQVCIFIRKCIDKKIHLVPVSTNFSRHDIFQSGFAEMLEAIRTKYDVPVKYLRIEITESAIVGNSQYANNVIKNLHHFGYIVEMDDFGSGYSSLNVLKDIELDMVKLDMMFLSDVSEGNRGGTILSSVVRMAKWLGLPVIAEGIETVSQADYLRSVGCNYIQGYLYSKPLPESQYEEILSNTSIGTAVPHMKLIDTLNAFDFWNPHSQETLIFSNYVGGAAIFEYDGKNIEILRVNQKYLQEICMNLSEKDLIESDFLSFFDEANKKIYLHMLDRAIETLDEQECETWRTLSSSCCGDDEICIRCNVRMIGKSENSYLFYAMIRNITAEKNHFSEMLDTEKRFKMVSEQVNIYFWEYTVATREMRPCFRCMRDLGLPALLTNYPESAIQMGVFPPEVADMYRNWHKQIAEGVPTLEAVMPLTMGRVPFRVRYTTEFDENGHAVKAYGSAALVVDGQ